MLSICLLAVAVAACSKESPKAATPEGGEAQAEKVAAPSGNRKTVADVITKHAELKDQVVELRGKVVKYNPSIMGKNWVHLQDGSGSEADGTNDILITTQDTATVDSEVTVTGTVHVDQDFGAGYSYEVLVEDATITP
jgi:hypothetical protein